jgi:nitroimidazol reductase NimA-like FMN-containing flavoprotein (pyridoxamine 5'-phosphate oxidase superfamily)
MRSNPLVCVELDEVEEGDQWMSIVVFGSYEELSDTSEQDHLHSPAWRTTWPDQERSHAHKLLQQYADWWKPGCASYIHRNSEEPLKPIFYRIRIDRISGRRGRPSPSESVEFRTTSARDNQRWLPRVLHALCKPFAVRGMKVR